MRLTLPLAVHSAARSERRATMNTLFVQQTHMRGSQFRKVALAAGIALVPLIFSGCHQGGSGAASESGAPKKAGAVKLIQFAGDNGVEIEPEGLRLAGVTTFVAGVQ